MVEVVVLVTLEVVLPAAVRGRGRDEEMDAVPHEGEWRGEDKEGWTHARVVVEVLDGVHAQPSERLDVGVAVVEGVDVLVERLDVDEPVGEVEVELSVEGHPEGGQDEHGGVPGGGEGLLVAHVGQAVGGVAVHEDGLPDSELDDAHEGVEHVVQHLGHPVLPVGHEGPL